MNCQSCGTRLFPTDRTCPSCGAPIKIDNKNFQVGCFVHHLDYSAVHGKIREMDWKNNMALIDLDVPFQTDCGTSVHQFNVFLDRCVIV